MSDYSQDSNKPNFEMFNGAAKAHLNGAVVPVENSGSDTGTRIDTGVNFGTSLVPKLVPTSRCTDEPVSQYQEPQTQYFKTPNEVSDVILQVLDGDEFKLYFRLFRLSHGYKQTTCFVGYASLARACNMPVRKVKRLMPRLLASGLVRVLAVFNSSEKRGTLYEVLTGTKIDTGVKSAPIKGKDDLDSKGNHHQRQTMAIFTELTGRAWTKADAASYRKVAEVPIEKLEFFLRLIHKRALEPVRSFAFFAASVQNELAAAASGQGAAAAGPAPGGLKQKYQKFAAEIRAVYLGGGLAPSALIDKLKGRCIREGVPWNDDVANEVFGV